MLDFWKQKKTSASASAIRLLNSESFFERLIRYLSTACMTTIISKNSEEPMTKVTGFQQSVRLFQSYDPVTPSILSSFLLHLSDALPSGRVLLRLSVRHPYADSPTAVQALKVDSHHGSHASPRYRCFVIWLFTFPECLSICDRFYTLLG